MNVPEKKYLLSCWKRVLKCAYHLGQDRLLHHVAKGVQRDVPVEAGIRKGGMLVVLGCSSGISGRRCAHGCSIKKKGKE